MAQLGNQLHLPVTQKDGSAILGGTTGADYSLDYLTTEYDPVFAASPAGGITAEDVLNWDAAYGWGNPSGVYSPIGHNHSGIYEPVITAGLATQYWRGDKTFQVLNSSVIGLENVPNVDATNPANIVQTSSYRFASDAEKSTWNSKQSALNGTGFVKISGTTISYDNSTYYFASNPSGYTSNTGTVTSISGAGTVSGLTLTGTVTTSGSLTLGGTLSVVPANFASQIANTVLAAPNGVNNIPSFRFLAAADIPNLDASKITSGTIDAARLPSYVDDVLEYANITLFPVTGETGKIYIALDTNKTYRWSGSVYVYITSGAVDSVGGYTGVVTATNLLDSIKTVDGSSSGLDADLLDGQQASYFQTALNGSGLVRLSGTTLTYDSSVYITGNQSIALSSEASGTGTTSIAVTLNNAAVIGKLLTGYSATSGTISGADTLLSSIQKLGYDKHVAVTIGTANGLSLVGQALSMGLSSGTTVGALSSTDWTTFNSKQASLGFTPENVANKITSLVTGYPYTNDQYPSALATDTKLQEKQSSNTGFVTGLTLSINADTTKYDISSGRYIIVDWTDPVRPIVSCIVYAGSTGHTPSFLATANATYVFLDASGNVVESASPITNAQRRDYCSVGAVIHSNRTNINTVNSIKMPALATTNQLHDFIKAIGTLNIDGNIYGQNGANLSIDKSNGTIFGLGINATDMDNPHQLAIGSQTALTFRYRLRGGTEYADTTSINPNSYDLNGTLTPVGSNKFTVQHINLFQSGLTRIQYGQTLYGSMDEALANLRTDPFVLESNIADNAIFRCYLVVREGLTDLASAVTANYARFIPVDKFGTPVGGVGTVLTYSAVIAAIGYTPENEANKVTSISALSTNLQYPSAKLVYDSLLAETLNTVTSRGATTTNTLTLGNVNISPTYKLTGTTQGFIDVGRCGFSNRGETTIAFDGVKIFTLADAGAGWSYYRNGIKYSITGNKTVDLTTVDAVLVDGAKYFIVIDSTDGTLSASKTVWTLADSQLPVAIVAWNNTLNPKYFLQEERHSIAIDRFDHWYNHTTRGTQYVGGGDLTGYTITTNTDAANTFAIGQSEISDEDIRLTLALKADGNGADPTNYTIMYRSGVSSWAWEYSDMPFKYTTNGYINWDNGGTITQGTGGAGGAIRYYNTYLILTNTQGNARFVIVTGQGEYTTTTAAYGESFSNFSLVGFPKTEWLALYQMTWQTGVTGLTNKGKVMLTRNPQRIITSSITASSVTATSHNSLTGLQGGILNEYYHLTLAQYTIATQAATSSVSGYLTSTDWSTFNSKQAGSANLTSLSGLTYASASFVKMTGVNTFSLDTAVYSTDIHSNITALNAVSGTNTGDNSVNSLYSGLATSKQDVLSGTGFVKSTAGTISYDTNTYYLASNPSAYITQAGARTAISLTTLGTSGAATYNDTTGVLNIPQYPGGSGMIYPSAGIALSTGSAWGTSITDNSSNWNTAYSNRISSLTTTGTSGAATLISNVLNIPTYTLEGLGGQTSSASLTSLAGLSYVSASFVKMTGANTFSLDTNTYYLASNPSGYTTNTGTVTSVAALTVGTTGTDLSSSVATGTTTPVITLNVPTASATNRGALSSADWTSFNGKQAALSGTGFVKISGTTISYDNSTYVTGTPWTSMGYLTGNQTITLSGDVTGSGATAITTTIGPNKVTLAMMAQITTASFLGRNTAASGNVEVLSVSTVKTMLGLGSAAYTASTDYATSGHTHATLYQPLATVLTNTTASYTTAEQTKLAGIATGATNVTNNNQLTNGAGYITSAGSCAYATSAGSISGFNNPTTAATASTIVYRDTNGYINGVFFNSSRADESTAAASYIFDSGDGWLRKKTLANAKTELVTSAAVIAGLTYTPYSAANPAGYITSAGSCVYATSAGNADTVDSQHFAWSNSDNNPSYLWGANINGSSFLVARASMSVLYATTAGSAPASDVYSWAKAATKPTYSYSEVGAASTSDSRLSDERVPTATSVTYAKNATEFVGDLTVSSNAIDWSTGVYKEITLTANTTFTFTNLQKGKSIVIRMTGSFTPTLPASCELVNGGTYTGTKYNYLLMTCVDSSSPKVLLSINKTA